jgi:hypothetical protein
MDFSRLNLLPSDLISATGRSGVDTSSHIGRAEPLIIVGTAATRTGAQLFSMSAAGPVLRKQHRSPRRRFRNHRSATTLR